MDNVYSSCPALMSDGRFLTDWNGSTRRNEYIKHINDLVRDDDYRVFLQQNGSNILNKEWNYLVTENGCKENGCVHQYPTRMPPQLFSDEVKAFNQMSTNPNLKPNFPCKNLKDYRLHSQ